MRDLLPADSFLLEDHFRDGLRSGEGSAVELHDGSLLLLYTRFSGGGGDADSAQIVARRSSDHGAHWSEPKVVFEPPPGSLNFMSVSLLRLQDGRIGMTALLKRSTDLCLPIWSYSSDEGASWAPPTEITGEVRYFVVNNDRLVQLEDGTLLLPYAVRKLSGELSEEERAVNLVNMPCGLFTSTDAGRTWSRSPHQICHQPEFFREPLFVDSDQLDERTRFVLANRLGRFQEPGVVTLGDGSLMMYMRSSYAIYRCFARNWEAPWEECDVVEGYHVCCGPQTIKRHPVTGQLIMLYNDRGTVRYGDPWFSQRTPLSVACSKDEGRTWQRLGNLEGEDHNYCYFSLLFLGDRFLATYYQSAIREPEPNRSGRRNLASLRVCHGKASVLVGE